MKVAHVITGLNTGGAETMLVKLLSRMDRREFEPLVVSLLSEGPLSEHVEELGVGLRHLDMRRGALSLAAPLRLASLLRDFRPDLVQTWLYHADLLGLVAARLARSGRVVWNLRCSNMDLARYGRLTRLVVAANARLSRLPAAVVSNSRRSLEHHLGLGYRPGRGAVIPNGFDLERFRPDPGAAAAVRAELGIPEGAPIVGLVARLDPMKGHETFFAAAALLAGRFPEARFLLAGDGMEPGGEAAAAMLRESGATADRVFLLGRRSDVDRLNNAFTVAVNSSWFGEGFPNVLGEAMACGTPCVVTDVGEAPEIVGETGRVVPPRDAPALAEAVGGLLAMSGEELEKLGRAARKRVEENYSLESVTEQYAELYRELVNG
jgi:glycosyltransferase involved in cell wall biosynthesis